MKAETFPKFGQNQEFSLPLLADLENQFQLYLKKIDRDLEDLGLNPNFTDGVESLYRDSNTLAILAMAIGLSPEKGDSSAAMPGVVAAVQKVSDAKNLDEATSAVKELKASVTSSASGDSLEWKKVANLSPLMKKALPALTTEIKRLGRNEKTLTRQSNLDKVIGASATLTVLAIGCRPNVGETLAPTETKLWESYCDRLYETARKLNESAVSLRDGKGSFDDFSAAFKEVDATCNSTCHEKFGGIAAN